MIDGLLERLIDGLVQDSKIVTKRDFQKYSNTLYRETGVAFPFPAHELIEEYQVGIREGRYIRDTRVWNILRKRAVRSLSGVSVISFLTKFWGCPGKCVYCPTFDTLPKSYVPNEPAVMRAVANDFDPVLQIQNRLRSLEATGHVIAKCDVRVIGGTWSFYPREYQEMVMRSIYDAHSTYTEARKHLESGEKGDRLAGFKLRKSYEMQASSTLQEAQIRNESADSRVIGIAIETRPDWITEDEVRQLRHYGVTRVEIGYQTTRDDINELNKRGHGNAISKEATRLLKDAGFKVVAHMMPNLLGSNPDIDRESMQTIFDDSGFRPDELKIYPMVVTDKAELTDIWKEGGFTPYDDTTLIDLMADLESYIPEYTRLNRSYRDIPASEILAGSTISNLREVTTEVLKNKWLIRRDISSREIRAKSNLPEDAIFEVIRYEASGGIEYFLQYIDPSDRTLFGLLRLRVPSYILSQTSHYISDLQDSAIIREVHVFGDQLPIGALPNGSGQHQGFGKRLVAHAEDIIRKDFPHIPRMAVISGVGAKPYYRKLGYTERGTYLSKVL